MHCLRCPHALHWPLVMGSKAAAEPSADWGMESCSSLPEVIQCCGLACRQDQSLTCVLLPQVMLLIWWACKLS